MRSFWLWQNEDSLQTKWSKEGITSSYLAMMGKHCGRAKRIRRKQKEAVAGSAGSTLGHFRTFAPRALESKLERRPDF
jgi:ethanolamine ammonia-lyase large subunit